MEAIRKRMKAILIIVLLCIFYQVLSIHSSSTYSCYANNNIKIFMHNFPDNKYSSAIYFQSADVSNSNNNNYSSINDLWKPCNVYDPPLTNNTFKQIRALLNLMHLTNESISCDQLNQLYSLNIHYFPFDYYYNIGQIGNNSLAINQSLCQSDLERLDIYLSPKAMNKVIRNESFCAFRKLKNLTISFSGISEIEVDAFICLEHLIEIDLRFNKLYRLPRRVFGHNQRLHAAILTGNRFNSIFGLFSSFRSLTNISVLDLSLNQIEILAEVIPLKRLKRLDLSSNKLREVNRNAFSELVEIEAIVLSHNQLTEFHAETFKNNAKIKSLIVENNALKSIPKIDSLSKLENLDLSFNQIASINLPSLSLNDNEIERIIDSSTSGIKISKPNFMETLSKLRIDLSNNRIQSLRNVNLPDRVYDFDVRNNQIHTVCNLSLLFTNNYKVKNVLQLSGNPLRCNNCVNRELKFHSYRMIIKEFEDLKCNLQPPPLNLKQVKRVKLAKLEDDGSVCRIEFNCSEQSVCYEIDKCSSNPLNGHCYALTDALRLNVTHVCQHLTEIPSRGYYKNLFKLSKHHMHFKRNNIEKLKLVHFDDDELLIDLQCVAFYLETSNVRIIENQAFRRMKNLEILSLRNNRIRVLPNNLFRNLTKLKELYLSNNRLITLAHQTINNVIKLELHNNSLTHLPIIINTNQLLSLSDLTNLSLHDNPWSCECEFIQPFHNYLLNNIDAIQRVKDINCTGKQRRKYNVLQFDLSNCEPFLYLTAITTSTTFAVVIIIITVLIFIYRREVRVLIYSRYRLRIFGPEVDDDVGSKQYDAFMAYNSKDEDFLFNHLMPGLEAIPNPYRLCIHERDFPAGAFIQDSIIQAVQLSSRTIVLLSENFVESGWCRMEFKTAHAQMMQDRCPRVLLIVLGEIPRNLDPEMELYLRTNTYLRWGERLFWEKLYYAMPDQRVTAPATELMPNYEPHAMIMT